MNDICDETIITDWQKTLKMQSSAVFLAVMVSPLLLILTSATLLANETNNYPEDEFESGLELALTYESISEKGGQSGSAFPVDRETSIDLTFTRLFSWHPTVQGFMKTTATSEQFRLTQSGQTTKNEFVELEKLWGQWTSSGSNPYALRLGRQTIGNDNPWWWDEEVNALSILGSKSSVSYQTSIAVTGKPLTTDNIIDDPEEDSIYWAFGSMHYKPNDSTRFDTYLTHKSDRSQSYTTGQRIPPSDFDETDDRVNWVGARLERTFGDHKLGLLKVSIDAALMRGKSEQALTVLEEEGEEEVEEEPAGPETETDDQPLEVTGSVRERIKGWAVNTWLGWALPFSEDSVISLGYSLGSGTKSGKTDRSRTFRQTGLQDVDSSHGVLLQPELSNLAAASVRIDIAQSSVGNLRLQYNRFYRHSTADDSLNTEVDLEFATDSRDIGYETSLVYELEFDSGLKTSATIARFKPGYALGATIGSTIKYYELAVTHEF